MRYRAFVQRSFRVLGYNTRRLMLTAMTPALQHCNNQKNEQLGSLQRRNWPRRRQHPFPICGISCSARIRSPTNAISYHHAYHLTRMSVLYFIALFMVLGCRLGLLSVPVPGVVKGAGEA